MARQFAQSDFGQLLQSTSTWFAKESPKSYFWWFLQPTTGDGDFTKYLANLDLWIWFQSVLAGNHFPRVLREPYLRRRLRLPSARCCLAQKSAAAALWKLLWSAEHLWHAARKPVAFGLWWDTDESGRWSATNYGSSQLMAIDVVSGNKCATSW